MKKLLGTSKYLIYLAVFSSLFASIATFVWGTVKSALVIFEVILGLFSETTHTFSLIELMDIFLIATVLLIFALGMYELFIGNLDIPEWLNIRNLHDLKVKISSVIILVMGIIFLKHLFEWQDAQGTLFFGLGITVVSAALIAFSYIGNKHD